jgi:glutamate-5-semialdehyde dehydrogenase
MNMSDLKNHAEQIGTTARRAAMQLSAIDGETRAAALRRIAEAIRNHSDSICVANAIDLDNGRQSQLAPALLERLKLDPKKIAKMADSVESIADQPEPVGQIIEERSRADGLLIQKLRVWCCFSTRAGPT